MKKNKLILASIALLGSGCLILNSCSRDDDNNTTPTLVVATSLDTTDYDTQAEKEIKLVAGINALVVEIKKGRSTATGLSSSVLSSAFAPVQPYSTNHFKSNINQYITEAVEASTRVFDPLSSVTGKGGVYGAYLFNAYGIEPEQKIEKGLFGAALYHQAVQIIQAGVTAGTANRLVAVIGSNPTFPNTNTTLVSKSPDVLAAVYLARRTDTTNKEGYYFQMKNALLKLQSAVKGGASYKKEQDEAAAAYLMAWEKSNWATVINYCIQAKATLSKTSPTSSDYSSALHALSEAIGFAMGWYQVPNKTISDDQIKEILNLFGVNEHGVGDLRPFIANPFGQVKNLDAIKDKVKAIYGFTDAEMDSFAKNWVTEQKR